MGARIDVLIGRTTEFDADDIYTMAVQDLLNKVAVLAASTIGKVALTEAFKAATATEADDTPDAALEDEEEEVEE